MKNDKEYIQRRQRKLARHTERRKAAQKKSKWLNFLLALGLRKEKRDAE